MNLSPSPEGCQIKIPPRPPVCELSLTVFELEENVVYQPPCPAKSKNEKEASKKEEGRRISRVGERVFGDTKIRLRPRDVLGRGDRKD